LSDDRGTTSQNSLSLSDLSHVMLRPVSEDMA
jgi:hypothetical protein